MEGNNNIPDSSPLIAQFDKVCKVKICNTLSFKLVFSLIILFTIIFTLSAYYTINKNRNHIMEIVEQNIINTGDIIRRSTYHSMLLNRREDVERIIKTIGNEEGFERINVYNKQGVISFSSIDSFMNRKVDLSSSECSPCHSIQNPKLYLDTHERTRIFIDEKGERIIGLIIPIENEQICSNGDCHAHDINQKILGVIDVQMSLSDVEQRINENRRALISTYVFVTIIISAFSGLFVWLLVHKRVKILIDGVKEITKGNYEYQLTYKSKDELGELSKHFNIMIQNLKRALDEIKSLNENLNIKVREKTEQLKNIYNHVNQIERIASLGKLSATVAHELNNPLEGILTYTKLIIKKIKNDNLAQNEKEKLLKYLELIATESERCGNIVKNLLLFSRAGESDFRTNDLINIVERSLLLINHHLQLNNITLIKDFCCNYLEFECDKNQIQQALLALFINAIEAMPDGGTLTVKIFTYDSFLVIKVSDSGIGIPKENLNKIFEPFFSTKQSGKGTGLGLSVVYGIVKKHQGKIEVESEVNKGTTFTLTFPKKLVTEMG